MIRDGAEDLEVGVADLEVDFEVVRLETEGLVVGVEERAVDLVGVKDLTGGAADLVEGKVAREVGVEDLDVFVVIGIVGRPVGVADRGADAGLPDDNGLLFVFSDEFRADDKLEVGCFVIPLPIFLAGSAWIFSSCNFTAI